MRPTIYRKDKLMPMAIQVREDNVDAIVNYGQMLNFDLTHLRDNLKYLSIYCEELYLITDGTWKENNITFTEFGREDFFNIWKFTEQENPNHFVRIARV